MPATDARVEFITQEYRTHNENDAAIKVLHPLAKKLTLASFFNNEADAEALAEDILAIRKEDRFNWALTLSERMRFNLVLGATYTITHPRFELASGKNFILRGVKWGSNTKTVDALFFGPQ